MPFLQIKNVFIMSIPLNKSFKSLDAVSKLESNLETFKGIGKGCLKVVLPSISGNLSDSVRLENLSK